MPQPSPSRTGYLEPATQDLIHHWILELEAQDVISGPQGRAAGSHQDLPDKGPDVQPISTETMTPKRTGKLGYERQPRYKTKEDRYEYKGSNGGNMCKKSSVKKIRSSKKARKHTINGNFHAPNVSRDRLTLRGRLDLGLFHRGKTSSPVKCRELKDFPSASSITKLVKNCRVSEGFSETKFLSKRPRDDNEDHSSYPSRNKNRKTQNSTGAPQKLVSNHFSLESLKNGHSEEGPGTDTNNPVSNFTPAPGVQSQAISAACLIAAREDNTVDAWSPTVPLTQSKRHRLKSQMCRGSSPSTTAYTWSYSDHAESIPESALDLYMRQILQFDLHSEDNIQGKAAHPNRKYWTLEELKLLLYKRERFWDQEGNGQPAPVSPIPDSVCSKHRSVPGERLDDADERTSRKMTNPKLRHDTGEKENAGKTSLDQEWIFPQSTHVNPGVECYKHNSSGNFDNWQPTPKNMINEYPTDNDYCSISETIACPQSFLESENSCYSPTLSQVINAIEHEEYHADGTQAQIGCRDDLDTQVLHRAFDAIVLSEEGPMCKVRDYGMEASFGTTSNEKPFLSQYISQIRAPWTGASAPYAFGTAGGMAGKHLMCGMTDHLLGSHATQDYGTCPEFIGLPRDFWRQNRLY